MPIIISSPFRCIINDDREGWAAPEPLRRRDRTSPRPGKASWLENDIAISGNRDMPMRMPGPRR